MSEHDYQKDTRRAQKANRSKKYVKMYSIGSGAGADAGAGSGAGFGGLPPQPIEQKSYGGNDRRGRSRIASETLAIVTDYANGGYTTRNGTTVSGIGLRTRLAVDNTQLYDPQQVKSLIKAELVSNESFLSIDIEVRECTVLEAAQSLANSGLYKNVAVLNFASAKNPGGGFLKGASAHEESIARSSGLYPCLTEARGVDTYYGENKKDKTCVYTNHMIFSPSVPVFRDSYGALLTTPYDISIITAPAVNAGAARNRLERGTADEVIADIMRFRIKGVLAIAKKNECDAIILGAWGCGCFRNDPFTIAKLFAQGLRVLGSSFKKVLFAIDEDEKCTIFRQALAPLIDDSVDPVAPTTTTKKTTPTNTTTTSTTRTNSPTTTSTSTTSSANSTATNSTTTSSSTSTG